MKKILIIDDAAFMRLMLKNILVKHGYEIVGEAENGKEGVELYEKLKPDIVTMDITMPEMNGLEAAQKILASDKNATIIMCSAMGQKSFVIEAINLGVKNFLVKPFKEQKVIEVISEFS